MAMYGTQRYHVTLGPKRTTVSLDNTLSILLSLRLGQPPQTPQAQRAVRHWLQARLDENGDYNHCLTSQWLHDEVVYALITDDLADLYDRWFEQARDTKGIHCTGSIQLAFGCAFGHRGGPQQHPCHGARNRLKG